MGFAALQTAGKYDGQAEQSKSCELARRLDGLIDESKAGFTIGRSVNPAPADNQLNGPVKTFKTRFTSMITAYCR